MGLIKILDAVEVIGGSYKGMHGVVMKETECMFYVQLVGLDNPRRVKKCNVGLPVKPSMPHVQKVGVRADVSYFKTVECNINAFRGNGVTAEVVDALDERMKLLRVLKGLNEKYYELESRLTSLVKVKVIGGKYKGMHGFVTDVTKEMFYVKLDGLDKEKRLMKSSLEVMFVPGNEVMAVMTAELELLSEKKGNVIIKLLDKLLSK